MPTPNQQAATAGAANPPLASQINQFLGVHALTYLYAGVKQLSSEVDGAAAIGVSGGPPAAGFSAVAQSIVIPTVAGATAIGYLGLFGKKVGNGCDLNVKLYTNAGGVPSAQQGVVSCVLPADFWTTSNGWMYVPLPISGLTATSTYWVVLSAGDLSGNNKGDASNYISLEKSTSVSGAATFGTTWGAVAYGFMYREFDQSVVGNLTMAFVDAGARWSYLAYDGSNNLTGIYEYTVSQANGQMRSVRTVTMSGDTPVSIA